MTTLNATYTKLRNGTWGAKVMSAAVNPGDAITVTKKSGETKSEIVSKVFYRGEDIAIVSLRKGASEKKEPSTGRSRSHYGRSYFRAARGRCEDAPCCGCCDAYGVPF
jgi:hypothetical protein